MERNRCVNIDWLEVFCYEPPENPRTPEYYEIMGYKVERRGYGTRMYAQMFTIQDSDGIPLIECRREPTSLKQNGGIFELGACHYRLVNRTCYVNNPIDFLREFLIIHSLKFQSIKRLDICLDFNQFDSGKNPSKFVAEFMRGEIAKINQANISAHGKDGWDGRIWNSLKWGAPTSAVSTKLYNKTLELKEGTDKPWIRENWKLAGLTNQKDVWRVEFSINSNSNSIIDKNTGEYVLKSLDTYDDKRKLMFQWHVLASHYFHFKKKELTRNGTPKPKNRCADVPTFLYKGDERYFTPSTLTFKKLPGRFEKIIIRKLLNIATDKSVPDYVREAAEQATNAFFIRYETRNFSKALQSLINWEQAF